MNDLFNRIFLKICLHLAVSVGTVVIWYLLNLIASGEAFYVGLWICLFITNCTTLILSAIRKLRSDE